jgi:pyruvate/2-oxoglutarate dehydrogenase complex dihydrolipoamide acyltransferase (E2) component
MAEIIVMPKMNLTMEEGVLVEWCKKLGDTVKAEEILCNIETEKSMAEMESPANGVLLKIWGVEGETYRVSTPIALIGEPGEDVSALIEKAEKLLAGTLPGEPVTASAQVAVSAPPETRIQVKMLPKVRKLAQDLGIDIAALAAYCGDRKITEEEVLAFQQASQRGGAAGIQLAAGDRRLRMSSIRRTIAANMSESCQKTARLTNITEVDMTRAMDLLAQKKENGLSITALVVKACALAIQEHDIINTVVDGDDIIFRAGIHIGVAVDIPGGLVVPVLRDANTRDIYTLAEEIADFAARGRQGVLSQDDLSGGTFTISNAGMLGLEIFTPIINYPETAIMGIGSVMRLPRFLDDTSATVVSRFIMKLCLSYDHRVIDGAPAARFSLRVRDLLQNPEALLS